MPYVNWTNHIDKVNIYETKMFLGSNFVIMCLLMFWQGYVDYLVVLPAFL
jgi:hypothetical protein